MTQDTAGVEGTRMHDAQDSRSSAPPATPQADDVAQTYDVVPLDRVRDDARAYVDQARWLIGWHHDRAAMLASRAVSILGFVGVILALFPAGLSSVSDVDRTSTQITTAIALAALLVTAVLCLMVLAPRGSGAPQIRQLRDQWAHFLEDGPHPQTPMEINLAESLLHASHLDKDSPVDLARREADSRAMWFVRATYALFFAVAAVAVLALQLSWT